MPSTRKNRLAQRAGSIARRHPPSQHEMAGWDFRAAFSRAMSREVPFLLRRRRDLASPKTCSAVRCPGGRLDDELSGISSRPRSADRRVYLYYGTWPQISSFPYPASHIPLRHSGCPNGQHWLQSLSGTSVRGRRPDQVYRSSCIVECSFLLLSAHPAFTCISASGDESISSSPTRLIFH